MVVEMISPVHSVVKTGGADDFIVVICLRV